MSDTTSAEIPQSKSHILSAGGPVGNYRWTMCALLFFATTVNYIDRQILSMLKETLDQAPPVGIGWTNTEYGWVNASFQIAYGIGLLGFGWFVDRFGTKIGYAVSIAGWSVAAASHALAGSVSGFLTARVFLGVSEAGNFPSAIKAVALWFPKRERAFATSIFNAGTNAGALFAPAIIPLMARNWGWRSTFIAAGIVGLLWLFLWVPFYETPTKSRFVGQAELDHIRSDREEEREQDKVSWLSLLGYRQTWSFITGKLLTDPVWWFFLIWLPDFFKKTYGLDLKKSWIHLVTVYAIITVLSIFGGWITGYLAKSGWSVTRARKTGMFLFALCVVPVYFATNFSAWPAVLLIALAGSAHQAWSANLYTTVSDMFPKKAVASVVGLGGMAGAVGGILFPVYCGHVLDQFKHAGNETGAYTQLLKILPFAYVLAFAINHFCAPRFEPIQLKAKPSKQ
jgi:MFS transporter, ACS family, hexuronate transporter